MRGIPPDLAEVEVGPGTCGVGYTRGGQYLVLYNAGDRSISLSESVERAAPSLALFRALASGEHLTVIEGKLAQNVGNESVDYAIRESPDTALPGVSVIAVAGDGTRFSAASDSKGTYSLIVPGPGRYRVEFQLTGYIPQEGAYEVEVAPDSCKELNLGMWTSSRITGRLFQADGKPAVGIPVDLETVGEDRRRIPQVVTDASGKFDFVRIPTGIYIAGVNTKGLNSKLPYAPVYFPGVRSKAEARTITVSGAHSIDGVDFRVGPRRATRKISTMVEWSDGRPAINASITCTSSFNDPDAESFDGVWRYVDSTGTATCEVLTDRNYVVQADGLSWEHSSRPILPLDLRPKFTVLAGEFDVHLRLVVDTSNDISATERPTNMAEFNDK